MKAEVIRVLSFDISLSSPGVAVVELRGGKAKVISVSHVKTDAKQPYAVRSRMIESWAHLFIAGHQSKSKPYDVVVRERYAGKFGLLAMFSAHAAVDRALFDYGLAELLDTEKPIPQQTVKKQVVGKGRAEKSEVENAVRQLTDYLGEFKTDDTSDAVAIALCWAIQNGRIEHIKLTN